MDAPARPIEVASCRRCGRQHGGLPAAITLEVPDRVLHLGPREREARLMIGGDTAALDNRHFFLRASVHLRVRDTDRALTWNIWFAVERTAFKRARALWRDARRELEAPIAGRLANSLPGYPPAFLLAALQPAAVGERFRAKLAADRHPLAVHFREGVPPAFLQSLAESLIHDG